MGKFEDLTGQKFGFLEAIERLPNEGRFIRWKVKCVCGNERIKITAEVKRGHSCGCWNRDCRLTHGHTFSSKTPKYLNRLRSPTYTSWRGMRNRCLNPKSEHYDDYGGRGIQICSKWDSFENFLADLGERPFGMTLDRVNNDGNYEPSNCRWASGSEQAKNKRSRKLITNFSDEEIHLEFIRRFGNGGQETPPVQAFAC